MVGGWGILLCTQNKGVLIIIKGISVKLDDRCHFSISFWWNISSYFKQPDLYECVYANSRLELNRILVWLVQTFFCEQYQSKLSSIFICSKRFLQKSGFSCDNIYGVENNVLVEMKMTMINLQCIVCKRQKQTNRHNKTKYKLKQENALIWNTRIMFSKYYGNSASIWDILSSPLLHLYNKIVIIAKYRILFGLHHSHGSVRGEEDITSPRSHTTTSCILSWKSYIASFIPKQGSNLGQSTEKNDFDNRMWLHCARILMILFGWIILKNTLLNRCPNGTIWLNIHRYFLEGIIKQSSHYMCHPIWFCLNSLSSNDYVLTLLPTGEWRRVSICRWHHNIYPGWYVWLKL